MHNNDVHLLVFRPCPAQNHNNCQGVILYIIKLFCHGGAYIITIAGARGL